MSLSSGSPGSMRFSIPSSPAISMAEKARYGLQEGSGERNSMRLALGEGGQGARVLQHTADVVERHLGHPGVALTGEERLSALPHRLMGVHPRAVVAEQRLGHEGDRLAVAQRDVLHHVLEPEQLVGGL